MKRLIIATTAAAAVAASLALPGTSDARTSHAKQVVTFQETTPQFGVDDLDPKSPDGSTLSLGDRLTIAGDLDTAGHKRLGAFGGTCTALGAGDIATTPVVCHAVYSLAHGQIATMGIMTLSKTDLVIVGGSGAYDGVHGTVTPGKKAKGFEDADKLTILR